MNRLIITGAHKDTLSDIYRIPNYQDFDFMAIGVDAVHLYPWRIKYVATYHPEDIPKIKERRSKVGNTDYIVICHVDTDPMGVKIKEVDIVEPHEAPSGSSSLLGTLAAIKMGYDKIILCGCPLTGSNAVGSYEGFRFGWEAKERVVKGRVKSMSGWTKEFLGEPTEEWYGFDK